VSPPKSTNPNSSASDQIQSLVQSLEVDDQDTRRQAIRKLGQLGTPAAEALPQLRLALSDPDFRIRLEAAIAIGFIGTKKETKVLLPLLEDEVEAVRFQTISALAFLKDSQVTPSLIKKFDSETIHVQDQILRALGHLGGPEAFPFLEKGTHADHPSVRTGAVVGLSFLGDTRSKKLLKKIAETDPDEIVAHEAKVALLYLQKTG
jgi:HEAT repeat protein